MCDTPFVMDTKKMGQRASAKFASQGLRQIEVPCGKCPVCIRRRVNSWVFRLLEEDKVSSSSYFITLTYDNDHVPISGNKFLTLDKTHLQKFWKKLRKKQKTKIKYYAVGEYGETFGRPHYHCIVFNVESPAFFGECWTAGKIDIGSVSGDSIGYCAGYINKGRLVPVHKMDDREKEFSVMSKGLGKSYLSPEMVKYHKEDITRNYVTLKGGAKIALPRYYRDRIYNETEKTKQRFHIISEKRKKELKILKEYMNKFGVDESELLLILESKKFARLNKHNARVDLKPRKNI